MTLHGVCTEENKRLVEKALFGGFLLFVNLVHPTPEDKHSLTELSKIHLNIQTRDTWVAQSVEYPTLDFGSGHGFMVCEFEPHIGLCTALTVWSLLGILSLSLSFSAPLVHALFLSLKINKLNKN